MDRHSFAPFGETLKTFRQNKRMTQQQLATKLGVHRNTIGSWERGDYLPEQRGIVLDLAKHLRLGDLEARQLLEASLTAISPYWSVPVPRNPCFTGRETVLQKLHIQLAHPQPVALTQTSALSGLGGIGKTQIAVEYAYRYALEHSAVFWVAAETAETLMGSMQQIAEQLHLPERQAAEQSQIVMAVQCWLATHTGWLLVMDNVEDPDLVQMVLPPARQGACLLTTRRRALGPLVELLEVPTMTSEEGINLLQRRAQGKPASEPSPVPAAAVTLVNLLEGLPLALDQAGAYIEETGCGIEMYLRRFHDQRKHVLAHRGTHGGAHPNSVTTTLLLAVAQIEHTHPAAADLLRLCVFLHPEAIPEELFSAGAPHLGSVLGPVAADPYQFDVALAALRNASLVSRHPETQTLSIHRLVQAVLQDQMEPADVHLWRARVICAINAAFPEPNFPVWPQCERYITQVLTCVPWLERIGDELPGAGELLFKTGSYLVVRGRYAEAQRLLEQALALGKQAYGTDHPALIPLLEKQGELFWSQGKYVSARQLWQQALVLGERHLGPTHPQVAELLSDLGNLASSQGEYEQAEAFHQQALSIQEEHLGPYHPHTVTTLHNLAFIYGHQGKYEQAEALYRQIMDLQEQYRHTEHYERGNTLNNLANVYRVQGKYALAEPLYQQALRIREKHLGAEHPRTANSLDNLATLYREQGHDKQAETLYQRALRIWEKQLGPECPQTAATLYNLALLYGSQGKYEQAETLYRRALHIWEQQLGPEHPYTAETLSSLASLYWDQGKYEQAKPLYQRALLIIEQQAGSEHPESATTLHNLASIYRRQGKYTQAAPLYQRILAIIEQQSAPDHLTLVSPLYELANIFADQRKYKQAIPLYQRALHILEQQLEPAHSKILKIRNDYSIVLEQSRCVCVLLKYRLTNANSY